MSTEARLDRLGLRHLAHKPEELAAALAAMGKAYEAQNEVYRLEHERKWLHSTPLSHLMRDEAILAARTDALSAADDERLAMYRAEIARRTPPPIPDGASRR